MKYNIIVVIKGRRYEQEVVFDKPPSAYNLLHELLFSNQLEGLAERMQEVSPGDIDVIDFRKVE